MNSDTNNGALQVSGSSACRRPRAWTRAALDGQAVGDRRPSRANERRNVHAATPQPRPIARTGQGDHHPDGARVLRCAAMIRSRRRPREWTGSTARAGPSLPCESVRPGRRRADLLTGSLRRFASRSARPANSPASARTERPARRSDQARRLVARAFPRSDALLTRRMGGKAVPHVDGPRAGGRRTRRQRPRRLMWADPLAAPHCRRRSQGRPRSWRGEGC
jgi:hypothetical protein